MSEFTRYTLKNSRNTGHFRFPEHKEKMEEMREAVEDVLRQGTFNGEYTTVTKGVGSEKNFVFDDMSNRHAFLSMTEDRKAICDMQYQLSKDSNISKDLFGMWTPPLPEATRMTTTYIINNNYSSCHRTVWTDKCTTVLFDEQTPTEFQ